MIRRMSHRLNEITAGGRTIRWRETNPAASRDNRPCPIVLLHAFPLSAAMWESQFDAFGHWRVIAPDVRGFRSPDGPAVEPPGEPTMDELATDIEHILDALGIPSAVIGGLSMGGYLAFALYRRAPARFRALVLADTRAGADSEEAKVARRKMQALADSGGAAAIAADMLPKLLGETTRRERPGLVARVRSLIEANSPNAIKGAIGAMMTRQDSSPFLQTIPCPTLILVGAEDGLTPVSAGEEMQHAIPGSRLVAVPRAGHLSNMEQPAAFNAALAGFLEDLA
jgi:pimeloyl-ACP methyl ester carboxylesterase